ncbi:MAG: PilZ domain-containing protein [Gammaproteobacteria bacterium]|nr:PilZ domain-containing protein [Gammaproteobacteria bacterium]
MAIDIERRAHAHIPIAQPVFLENATGFTHDVSASGVFFWISGGSYTVGDQISFSLEMSRPEGRVMIKCRGVVVRVEQNEARLGVAVKLTETDTKLP